MVTSSMYQPNPRPLSTFSWLAQVPQAGALNAGVVLGHYLEVDTTLLQNHRRIGIAAVVLAGLQVSDS